MLLLCVAAATQLESVPSTDLLAGSRSEIAKATSDLTDQFGQDPIAISLEADLSSTLAPGALTSLLSMEGRLNQLKGVKAVYGPGTFINQTVVQTERIVKQQLGAVGRQADAAEAAAVKAAQARGDSPAQVAAAKKAAFDATVGTKGKELQELLVRFGSVGLPGLANANFVKTLVFGAGIEPKQRFKWLFPDAEHALILVRPDPGVSGPDMLALGKQIRRVVTQTKLGDAKVEIAGLPLLAAGLERETRAEILRLAPIAGVAMLLLLLLVLRRRRGRLAALALALGSLGLTLGLSLPLGLGLTVSTVAALPVILGLGLDFAVQLQARYWLERADGLAPDVAARAAREGLQPTLLLAAGAMAAGFLVLMVGPVPLIDRLGAVLAIGVLSAVAVALLVGPALLVALDRGPVKPLALPGGDRLVRFSPAPIVIAVVVGLAVAGLVVSDRVDLQSDISQLAPSNLEQLKDTQAFQREIGTSGQISVAVRATNVTDPAVLTWLGEVARKAQSVDKRLSAGPNLADLVTGGDPTAQINRSGTQAMMKLLPPYFLDAVVSKDRRTAELTYGVPFVSVDEQGRIARRIDDLLKNPPAGVSASVAGLVAESANSTRQLDRSRPWLLLLAAGVVGAILFAFWRDWRRVALVLAPALLAAGLSSLVLALSGVTLSPLAAALEPLVLAIGLEFGMLLDMSFRQARAAGRSPAEARAIATRDIGGAVGLSAATVAVGFAVLGASRLPLLAQLGWLVAAELVVCLVVAVLIVPMVSERMAPKVRAEGSPSAGRTRPGARPSKQEVPT
ncbi:hypothetical protein DSM112329_00890 [Paraconexibacter sp. AEG42_29]|uniref:Membrane transport protein MMPL domain-containing protein n=1 Tax=Paraconexibacter sp. AEG42_29 TaxID=2997339 RepID=A0AAU7AQU2_9ACTN